MPIRDLLNVQLLSFTVSAALLGVGLALANQTHEMRQGEHYSEHYSGYIRTAAYFVAVFGALSQMYLYAAYIVPSITPGTKQVLSIRARVTLLLPLIVYGLFAMVYISTKAFIFENLPYTWYGWGSEEPYDHLARIFNGTDSKPPPGFPSDIDWRRMQVNGYVSSIIHEAGWKATVGTRVAG
jgi:hypothetical protein